MTPPAARLAWDALARVPDAELEALRQSLIREGEETQADSNRAVPAAIRADLALVAEEQAARYLRRSRYAPPGRVRDRRSPAARAA